MLTNVNWLYFVTDTTLNLPILAIMEDNYMTELQEFAARLNAFLMDRFGYKQPLGVAKRNRSIHIHRAKVKLYIRYRMKTEIYKYETFVLAEMDFLKERQGHGTAVLKFICDHCINHGIQYIAIEHANHKSAAFALKYGFHQTEEKGCYLVAVDDLQNKFVNIL